jgi:hypothetical protein
MYAARATNIAGPQQPSRHPVYNNAEREYGNAQRYEDALKFRLGFQRSTSSKETKKLKSRHTRYRYRDRHRRSDAILFRDRAQLGLGIRDRFRTARKPVTS